MRIAICTMGIVGGYDGTNGAGEQIHPRLSYESLKRKVIDVNPDVEFDIFTDTEGLVRVNFVVDDVQEEE